MSVGAPLSGDGALCHLSALVANLDPHCDWTRRLWHWQDSNAGDVAIVTCDVGDVAREEVEYARALASSHAKAMESLSEAAKVAGEQLCAYAALLEEVAMCGGSWEEDSVPIAALLAVAHESVPTPSSLLLFTPPVFGALHDLDMYAGGSLSVWGRLECVRLTV